MRHSSGSCCDYSVSRAKRAGHTNWHSRFALSRVTSIWRQRWHRAVFPVEPRIIVRVLVRVVGHVWEGRDGSHSALDVVLFVSLHPATNTTIWRRRCLQWRPYHIRVYSICVLQCIVLLGTSSFFKFYITQQESSIGSIDQPGIAWE